MSPSGARARPAADDSIRRVATDIVACELCPRLRDHCAFVAREKRRAYRAEEYWGRPVPGFGDPEARLLIVGLAPAAHGANRTGRMFTGDSSGDWLYEALHRSGFANRPASTRRGDGLELRDVYVTAAARCAPPANRPLPSELLSCRPFLLREMRLMKRVRVVLVLGRIAFDAIARAFEDLGCAPPRPKPRFAHGALWDPGAGRPRVLSSYHPSRQNTNTGRLRREMWHEIFRRAATLAG